MSSVSGDGSTSLNPGGEGQFYRSYFISFGLEFVVLLNYKAYNVLNLCSWLVWNTFSVVSMRKKDGSFFTWSKKITILFIRLVLWFQENVASWKFIIKQNTIAPYWDLKTRQVYTLQETTVSWVYVTFTLSWGWKNCEFHQ